MTKKQIESLKIMSMCQHLGFAQVPVEVLNQIIKEMGEAEKYRWHDLRADAGVLPNEGERIIFCIIDGIEEETQYWTGYILEDIDSWKFVNDDYERYITKGKYDLSEVIAWRYIEPFEYINKNIIEKE